MPRNRYSRERCTRSRGTSYYSQDDQSSSFMFDHPTTYDCYVCDWTSDTWDAANFHYFCAHGLLESCPRCYHQFGSYAEMRAHRLEMHGELFCVFCRLDIHPAECNSDIRQHLERCHWDQLERFTCKECSLLRFSHSSLAWHSVFCHRPHSNYGWPTDLEIMQTEAQLKALETEYYTPPFRGASCSRSSRPPTLSHDLPSRKFLFPDKIDRDVYARRSSSSEARSSSHIHDRRQSGVWDGSPVPFSRRSTHSKEKARSGRAEKPGKAKGELRSRVTCRKRSRSRWEGEHSPVAYKQEANNRQERSNRLSKKHQPGTGDLRHYLEQRRRSGENSVSSQIRSNKGARSLAEVDLPLSVDLRPDGCIREVISPDENSCTVRVRNNSRRSDGGFTSCARDQDTGDVVCEYDANGADSTLSSPNAEAYSVACQPTPPPHSCVECSRPMYNDVSYLEHYVNDHDAGAVWCLRCWQPCSPGCFSNRDVLWCKACDPPNAYPYQTVAELLKHLETEHGYGCSTCILCEQPAFLLRPDLVVKHVLTVHGCQSSQMRAVCGHCFVKFDIAALEEHYHDLVAKVDVHCLQCSKCILPDNVHQHITACSPREPLEMYFGKRLLSCGRCKFTLVTEMERKLHRVCFHDFCECKVCSKTFQGHLHFAKHLKSCQVSRGVNSIPKAPQSKEETMQLLGAIIAMGTGKSAVYKKAQSSFPSANANPMVPGVSSAGLDCVDMELESSCDTSVVDLNVDAQDTAEQDDNVVAPPCAGDECVGLFHRGVSGDSVAWSAQNHINNDDSSLSRHPVGRSQQTRLNTSNSSPFKICHKPAILDNPFSAPNSTLPSKFVSRISCLDPAHATFYDRDSPAEPKCLAVKPQAIGGTSCSPEPQRLQGSNKPSTTWTTSACLQMCQNLQSNVATNENASISLGSQDDDFYGSAIDVGGLLKQLEETGRRYIPTPDYFRQADDSHAVCLLCSHEACYGDVVIHLNTEHGVSSDIAEYFLSYSGGSGNDFEPMKSMYNTDTHLVHSGMNTDPMLVDREIVVIKEGCPIVSYLVKAPLASPARVKDCANCVAIHQQLDAVLAAVRRGNRP